MPKPVGLIKYYLKKVTSLLMEEDQKMKPGKSRGEHKREESTE